MRGETGVCGPFCWVWSWRARRLPDSCFARKNRLYLAHGRQRSLGGSWRGVTGIRRASCGLVGARVAAQALTPAIPLKDRLYLLRAERNPGRPRRTANVPRRRGVHLRLCASGSLASDAQLCPASSPRLALPIAVGRSVTVIFQHPGFPGSRGRRAAENSSLPPNRQPSKLSARPAAPPGRPARGFRTNTPTHTSTRAPPHGPEPPNQT